MRAQAAGGGDQAQTQVQRVIQGQGENHNRTLALTPSGGLDLDGGEPVGVDRDPLERIIDAPRLLGLSAFIASGPHAGSGGGLGRR